ncbi:cystathionine gamma-synthase [Campylobacterota bacterium]|nr:cystathionine gamma-synthase [Campylobacterota bacterium]
MRLETQLIHSPHANDLATGALSTPLVLASTFAQRDLEIKQEFDYSRSGNPTRKALEATIAQLENGKCGFAFSSGMAATSSVLGIFASGDHIVAAEDIYGGSYRILHSFFARWGLELTTVDASDGAAIKAAIKPNTKAIFLETPSNPLLKITDLAAAIAIAKERNLITIVDNTFMTPLLQRPIELGADIVVHSATKFLGGHSDVVLGLAVAATEELGRRIYAVQNGFGAVPSPFDCFLVLRGIKTLGVRLNAEQEGAGEIATWLTKHSKVAAVYYPALGDHPLRETHFKQSSGAGAVLSFKTHTTAIALDFLARTKLCAPAVSLGGVETIASYPVRMSHAAIPPKERERLGITDSLIRLSIGLENTDDLIADFEESLK